MTEKRKAIARNTAAILALISLGLVGLVAFQYVDYRNFKRDVYAECMERREFDGAANDLREAEVRRFRELGALALRNAALPGEQQQARNEAYVELASKAQATLDKAVTRSCGERP